MHSGGHRPDGHSLCRTRPARSRLHAWLRRSAISGSVAAVLSSLTLMLLCRARGKPLASASNATSHWIHGRKAWRRLHGDLRYTLPGYLIHHASSVFWALAYEAWHLRAPPRSWGSRGVRALAVATLAAVVDYAVVPKRLTPGFAAHLRPPPIARVYVAFAVGLALAPRAPSKVSSRPAACSSA